MTTVADMRKRLERFDLLEAITNGMEQYEEDLVDLNKDQMNEQGVDSKGNRIEPDYAPSTVAVKTAEGQTFSHVTLRDTGSFQRSMYLFIQGDSFDFDSSDSKTPDLVAKYGDNIFGLTSESKREAFTMLIPSIVRQFKQITGAI